MIYIISSETLGYLRELTPLQAKWTQDHREALSFRSLATLKHHVEILSEVYGDKDCKAMMLTPATRQQPTPIQRRAHSQIARMLYGKVPKRRRRTTPKGSEQMYHSIVWREGQIVLPYRMRTAEEVKSIINKMQFKLTSTEENSKFKRAYYLNSQEQELMIMKGEEPRWN